MTGAIFAGITFLICAVSLCFLQHDKFAALISQIATWVVLSIYYFFVAKHRQQFSEEEQKSLFVAHVINFNKKASNRRRRGHIKILVAEAPAEPQESGAAQSESRQETFCVAAKAISSPLSFCNKMHF